MCVESGQTRGYFMAVRAAKSTRRRSGDRAATRDMQWEERAERGRIGSRRVVQRRAGAREGRAAGGLALSGPVLLGGDPGRRLVWRNWRPRLVRPGPVPGRAREFHSDQASARNAAHPWLPRAAHAGVSRCVWGRRCLQTPSRAPHTRRRPTAAPFRAPSPSPRLVKPWSALTSPFSTSFGLRLFASTRPISSAQALKHRFIVSSPLTPIAPPSAVAAGRIRP